MVGDIGWQKEEMTAMRSGSSEYDWVQRAEPKEVEIEADEEEVAVVSRVVKTKNVKEVGTERSEEVGTKISEVESEVKEKDIVDALPTSSGAAEPEAGPDVEVLKSPTKKYGFIRDNSFNDLEN